MRIHTCECDGDLPTEFQDEGEKGLLFVDSCIGWIKLSPEDCDGEDKAGRNGCQYMFKDTPIKEG